MNLIALLLGLIVERLATQLFHLRQLRWFDRVIDAGFRLAQRFDRWPAIIPVLLLATVLVLPVYLVMFGLGDTLYGFPYMMLAIIVLFFSLGPKDIGEEVSEYCNAIEANDDDRIRATAKALLEREVPADPMECVREVEAAVFVQANNRLFAVVFWFVLLGPFGPLGAWAYRVTDLIRRRAAFNATRAENADKAVQRIALTVSRLHGWLAWVPARLTVLGYALAGNFDGALAAWRGGRSEETTLPGEQNENLLARVGVAAMALTREDGESVHDRGVRGATAATRLVLRLLGIWAFVIAAMTLYGWSL
ncbi:MAG: regulatory signaling modulator protein AmpE [Gammaproteobacteria bacterium]|nr:regulatory signaling modulator protein AmpE [Gammaproteobacteria bacterium]